MRPVKSTFLILASLFIAKHAIATIPERVGWWKFDNPSNLTISEAGYGNSLALVGSHSASDGPDAGNGSVLIGKGSYYKMQHLITPNGGGTKVNEYSIQYDFKISANNDWHSFFQTEKSNSDDGDFFINTSGSIGVAAVGYSGYSIIPNQWYRLIISVKNGSQFKCYLDGNLLLSGITQTIDGRFSLDNMLLIFADNDGEDNNIYCSELGIWNMALSAAQAKELGGFNHDIDPFLMTRIPYLQGEGTNTMTVCWHDTSQFGTKVEYGLNSSLGTTKLGTSEIISTPYRWHTVKIVDLQANTRYFYKVTSGGESSKIYSFKTLPDVTYTGKIRFVILGDTHTSDTVKAGNVIRAAKSKISELYGPDIENHINGIFHTGDIVVNGGTLEQYSTQFFHPLATLSTNIPTKVVAGNHEGESSNFYKYLKLDDFSAYPLNTGLNEKLWSQKIGNSLFIGLNANIISQYGSTEANWLDLKLFEAENDPDVDFVFLFSHHPPYSEMWYDVNTFDSGANYMRDVIIPIVKKYTKVRQMHYGHTHGFERGTIRSDKVDGDFRIICGGGGGGALDSWGVFTNIDYNDIHIAYDQYFFQILEIDIANHSYQNSMYSLGNPNKLRNSERLDTWYRKNNQLRPSKPIIENVEITDSYLQFSSSTFNGLDSIMSIQLQVVESSTNSVTVDSIIHWKDIYGVDNNYNPVNKNQGINLYKNRITRSKILTDKFYYFHVRYRDHNLKWSEWSNSYSFTNTSITNVPTYVNTFHLNQNYPNPFQNSTTISYYLPEMDYVKIRIYDTNLRLVEQIDEGILAKGNHQAKYNAQHIASGVYFYQIITKSESLTKKMIKLE